MGLILFLPSLLGLDHDCYASDWVRIEVRWLRRPLVCGRHGKEREALESISKLDPDPLGKMCGIPLLVTVG